MIIKETTPPKARTFEASLTEEDVTLLRNALIHCSQGWQDEATLMGIPMARYKSILTLLRGLN